MVSRNSAFALTVMLLVSSSAQAMSYLPSMPSLPSLPSFSSVFNKENGKFVAAVAASLVVIDLARNAGSKLFNLGAKHTPAAVAAPLARAYNVVHSRVPACLTTSTAAHCPVEARLAALEARKACSCEHPTVSAAADTKQHHELVSHSALDAASTSGGGAAAGDNATRRLLLGNPAIVSSIAAGN